MLPRYVRLMTVLLFISASTQSLTMNAYAGFSEGIAAYKWGDYVSARQEFSALAESGDAAAQFWMGATYQKLGEKVEAEKWYRQAGEHGNTDAQVALGRLYYAGDGVQKDFIEAGKWFREAAEQGNAKAQYLLGMLYYQGEGVAQDYAEALGWFRKSADQGDDEAQCYLGLAYAKGKGVRQNYAEAARWFQSSADKNNDLALVNLGLAYEHGLGVKKDRAKASHLFLSAEAVLAEEAHLLSAHLLSEEAGQREALYYLGLSYEERARHKYEKGARRGDPRVYKTAFSYFMQAAKKGHPDAQMKVGAMYTLGRGVPKDTTEGAMWLLKAAQQDQSEAQFLLGMDYVAGDGVLKDYVQAYMWFDFAASRGNMEGRKQRDQLAKKMTPSQIAEAQQLVKERQPKDITLVVANGAEDKVVLAQVPAKQVEDNVLLDLVLKKESCKGYYTVVDPKTSISGYTQDDNADAAAVREEYLRLIRLVQFDLKNSGKLKIRGYDLKPLTEMLLDRNLHSTKLNLRSSPKAGYVVDYKDEYSKYFEEKGGGWKRLRAEHPKASGRTHISLPAYDPQSHVLLIYFGSQFGWTAGAGFIVAYRYENGKLDELGRVQMWIS